MRKPGFVLLMLLSVPCAAMTRGIVLVPKGTVEARASGSASWVPVSRDVRLKEGDEVRTSGGATADVYFSDGSRFRIGRDSHFAVGSTGRKRTALSLLYGRLRAAVAGYFSSRVEVRTPSAVCAVRGTEFDVQVARNGDTSMNVDEGLVEVSDGKGKTAVVSSEEAIKVTQAGMSMPQLVSLRDDRAEAAARPMAVIHDTARQRTRTMLEELRNRQLKANEAELGKDAIDAFGHRVRLEEYLLRPSDKEFKLLFLSKREEASRLDWGQIDEQFHAAIPDDISKVGDIISGMYFSKTAPTNWMKYFEVYLTNTVDSVKETIDFTQPVAINFSGYTGVANDFRYYPGSIDWKQILSGPGVALAQGAGTNAPGLNADERMQFEQKQDWNQTYANNITFTQSVVDASGAMAEMYQVALNPALSASVQAAEAGAYTYWNSNIDPTQLTPAYNSYPSGPDKADLYGESVYADGSTLSVRKMLVSNEGDILSIPGNAAPATFLKEGSYNLEEVVGSSLFQGRDIDVLLAPEILNQKNNATTTADSFKLN